MVQVDAHELGQRLSAARCYSRPKLTADEMADKTQVSRSKLLRIEAGSGIRPLELASFIELAARASGLPVVFFTIDFARLSEVDEDVGPAEVELRRELQADQPTQEERRDGGAAGDEDQQQGDPA